MGASVAGVVGVGLTGDEARAGTPEGAGAGASVAGVRAGTDGAGRVGTGVGEGARAGGAVGPTEGTCKPGE